MARGGRLKGLTAFFIWKPRGKSPEARGSAIYGPRMIINNLSLDGM